jgi:hypothetical protein
LQSAHRRRAIFGAPATRGPPRSFEDSHRTPGKFPTTGRAWTTWCGPTRKRQHRAKCRPTNPPGSNRLPCHNQSNSGKGSDLVHGSSLRNLSVLAVSAVSIMQQYSPPSRRERGDHAEKNSNAPLKPPAMESQYASPLAAVEPLPTSLLPTKSAITERKVAFKERSPNPQCGESFGSVARNPR